jgi:hypothetical protein
MSMMDGRGVGTSLRGVGSRLSIIASSWRKQNGAAGQFAPTAGEMAHPTCCSASVSPPTLSPLLCVSLRTWLVSRKSSSATVQWSTWSNSGRRSRSTLDAIAAARRSGGELWRRTASLTRRPSRAAHVFAFTRVRTTLPCRAQPLRREPATPAHARSDQRSKPTQRGGVRAMKPAAVVYGGAWWPIGVVNQAPHRQHLIHML